MKYSESLIWTKKQLAIFISVVERSSGLMYAQQELKWSLHLLMVATKQLQSGPLRPALKGALMDVKFHSEIGTPLTMIEVMTCIQVVLLKGLQSVQPLLKSIGRLDYPKFISQDDECVTVMMTIPPGKIMGQVHCIADQSDKAHATKGTDHGAWMVPGNIICVSIIEATIMSLTLHNQSMDHLQAN